jgi:hypothetical protein
MRTLWRESKDLWADRDYYKTRLREKLAVARAVLVRLYEETIAEVPEDEHDERGGGSGGETAWGGYR